MFKVLIAIFCCVALIFGAEAAKKSEPVSKSAPKSEQTKTAQAPKVSETAKPVLSASAAQMKQAIDQHMNQIRELAKIKEANDKSIASLNASNQKLAEKRDSLITALKTKLQEIYDGEMKKIQSEQTASEQKKAEVENAFKEATSGLPK